VECVLDQPLCNAEQLLQLEIQARAHGTGIQQHDLIGCWLLQQVWAKGSNSYSVINSTVLRAIRARLEIAIEFNEIQLCNIVNLGNLELRFIGKAKLQGKRPLLLFEFNQILIKFGRYILFRRLLPAPMSTRLMPFFALIARDRNGWLAARGRGGGLALWQKDLIQAV
jgi:hypothetical protein